MSPDEALAAFYARHHFTPGHRSWFVGVYVGCMLVPLPNIEARHRFIKQHDLHHVVTGYGVGRIGEGQMSAWELGTGSMSQPIIGFMNLVALSTGFALAPAKVRAAFAAGLRSRNLYGKAEQDALSAGQFASIAAVEAACLDARPPRRGAFLAMLELAFYVLAACVIHAALVIPALLARTLTDLVLGLNLIPKVGGRTKVRQLVQSAKAA
jgi:hypothetical protein